MLKRIFIFCLILWVCSPLASALGKDDISAECAVLINADNNEIIYSKKHLVRHSMASTTKIMTALLAIESRKLQSEIYVSEDMLRVEGTSMGLQKGDQVSLIELVYGMLLASGNDAANTTAIYLGGSVEEFALMMNERAKVIGMSQTNFVTPSGLDDNMHYSTAYDMALLGAEAVKNPLFLAVCSDNKETLTYGNPPYRRTLYNHNKLLDKYDYALGIKTGFTKKSGRCLVSYALNDSVRLVAVTLNAPDDWNDHMKMLDYGFMTVKRYSSKAQVPESVAVVSDNIYVPVQTEMFSFSSCEPVEITSRVFIEKFIYSPIEDNSVVGYCEYYVNGDLADIKPITVNIN